jgi:hypothetical protein
MRRRSKASSKLAKAQSRKAMPKRRKATTVRAESESERLRRERDEALEQLSEAIKQQKAASEVLRLISGSPGELGAVFDAMLVNATRLCEARFGILLLWEGDAFRTVALHNAPPAFVEDRRREPISLRCTADGFGLSRNLARARHLRSHCRSSLSSRWSGHEQAHSGGGGPTG